MKAETNINVKAEMKAETNANVDAKMNAKMNAETNTNMNTEMNVNVNVEMNTETNANVNADMNPNSHNDVIAAIATPMGKAAIGVVRLSGTGTRAVLERIFWPKRCAWHSHQMYHGHIRDKGRDVDEVMCCFMASPRSYTREDAAEIYAHGGPATLRGVLEAVLRNGARPALPGEFTQRAFLHGRMDLAQAEAVMSLINARTDAAARAGLRQLGGGLSERINRYRDRLLTWLAHIELSIDYPEHESEAMNLQGVLSGCGALLADMERLLDTARVGRIITEGVRAAIIGRPNVGKSSLLNAILREDRAIVTDIPGTTRDVLSEAVQIRGIPLILSDTAGIRATDDTIERRGVEKSEAQAEAADLLLMVFDRAVPPQAEDVALWARFGGGCADVNVDVNADEQYVSCVVAPGKVPVLVLLNKCDQPPAIGWPPECSFLDGAMEYRDKTKYMGTMNSMENSGAAAILPVSAKTGEGLDALYRTIEQLFLDGLDTNAADADILTRERHAFLLEKAINHLRSAMAAVQSGQTEDLVALDLTAAYLALGEIIGAEIGDDIAERIFQEFCVGK